MAYNFALITGATSGIGECFARALPRETALLLTGREEAKLAALGGELAVEGRRVETVRADLARDEGREAVIARAADLPIDLLINNAGLGVFGPLTENSPEAEREMAEVNVVAPIVLTRALLPDMLARARENRRRAGLIVVGSTASFMPLPYLSTYSATKAFDLFFAEGLAAELKTEPIDVLALCPGATRTNFFGRAGMDERVVGKAVEPARVAREALAALGRRTVHVVGGGNQALAVLASRLPRDIMRAGARSYMSRSWRRYRR